jgi:hypothetical protein
LRIIGQGPGHMDELAGEVLVDDQRAHGGIVRELEAYRHSGRARA